MNHLGTRMHHIWYCMHRLGNRKPHVIDELIRIAYDIVNMT